MTPALSREERDAMPERTDSTLLQRYQAEIRTGAALRDALNAAEAEVERTRAERDFEERRADGLAAELAALRGRIEDVRETFYSGDYGALVESVRTLLTTPTDSKEA